MTRLGIIPFDLKAIKAILSENRFGCSLAAIGDRNRSLAESLKSILSFFVRIMDVT